MPATPPPLPPPPPSEPAGAAPDPEPRPYASPLNRDEERSLADLEGELRRSDPDLESDMSSLEARRASQDHFSLDRVLQAVAIAVIVLVLVPADWLAGILSFGLLLGIPFAMAMIAVRAKREGTQGEGGEPRDDGDDRRS